MAEYSIIGLVSSSYFSFSACDALYLSAAKAKIIRTKKKAKVNQASKTDTY